MSGAGIRPADYPPPVKAGEFVGVPTDPKDERIEVGLLIVGGGPAGLACAVRFGQLLEGSPELAGRLGDVPFAVVDKGKQMGSHLLSGACVNPRSLQKLFEGRKTMADIPTYGEVHGEAVYALTSKSAIRIPPPPTMRNHGNYVVSVSQLGRFLAQEAEGLGATLLPETVADRLLVEGDTVVGIRTGDKGRGKEGEELRNFEPGADLVSKVTVLAEGTQGHLTLAALERFGIGGQPQMWELGVKEVWKVAKPLPHVVHTMGWPLRTQARFREFGGSWIYPMGPDMVSLGMVVGLDYRDAELSAHDLLQELKTHKLVRGILEGGERVAWGAKTIPSGGFHALPKAFSVPGLMLAGDGPGMVNVPTLKGVHYAIEAGRLAAEAAFRALQAGEAPAGLEAYDAAIRESFIVKDLREVRNMRQVFSKGFFVGGALASAMTITKGKLPPGERPTERDAEQPLLRTGRSKSYPAPDGKLTFDKLSSVYLSGNRTRDDQPDHVRVEKRVPREVAVMWANMCPAQVYEVEEGDGDLVDVKVNPSNCVQCGAITAKGGRLTPPEGGSGPEYSLT